MIATFFLTILNSFLNLLLGFLPTGTLPTEVSGAITNIWGLINAFSYLIALDTFITVLLLVLAFDAVVLLWHVIQWVIRKIPGMQ